MRFLLLVVHPPGLQTVPLRILALERGMKSVNAFGGPVALTRI